MPRTFALAYHRGTLQECIETEGFITYHLARMLLKMGIYKFYAFDDRLNANRYILYQLDKNVGMPSWLHEYLDMSKRKKFPNFGIFVGVKNEKKDK